MPNTMTDQYKLVTKTTLQNVWLFFGPQVNYQDGFSRELFRNGQYIASIRSATQARQARSGDIVYAVNLAPQTLNWKGTLDTRDGYHVAYEAWVNVQVYDPKQFAIAYNQDSDPLKKTEDEIIAILYRRFRIEGMIASRRNCSATL